MQEPNYLLHVSEGAEEIAEQLHGEIIKRIVNRIMLRIGRGDDYILTAQEKWQLETLQQAGYLLEDIQKEIAKITKLQQNEIAEAMEEAGVKTLEYDDEVYRSAGLNPTPFTQSPELIRIAQQNYESTMGEFRNFTRTMAQQSQQLFIKECDRAYNLVSTGAMSDTEAVKEVINNVVKDGVKVTYPSGREDTIETATLRAVRTGISQMSAQIMDARMEEMNWDTVLVSSHLGARVTDKEDYTNHYWWQGKFYSRSGKDKRFQPFSLCGFGKVQGVCGANCRHSIGPGDGEHNPFKEYDSEENRKQYEKEQHQRTLERRIRDTKREVMGLKEAVDNCKDEKAKFELDLQYQKKAALLAKQNKAYKEYCESNNLRTRADRIQIAKWDRQQAATARGAAKRYENSFKSENKLHLSNKEELQNYRPIDIERSEQPYSQKRGDKILSIRKVENSTYNGDLYVSDNVKLKPKQMNNIEKSINKALKVVGGNENLPQCVIISSAEMQTGAICSYNAVKNIMYINSVVSDIEKLLQLQKDMACPKNPLSTYVHEFIHWEDAEMYRRKNVIMNQKEYLYYLRKSARKNLMNCSKEGIIFLQLANMHQMHMIEVCMMKR